MYYNPPPMPFTIDANTQITVCIDAVHTYVSDLGFYLVGPASCGSPTMTLAPNPGAIGNFPVCNSGQNINNLCFTTSVTTLFDVCSGSPPYTPTGNYGSYDPWSMIYGCDATSGGWSIQVYDCISSDVGALTHVSLTFSGNSSCGPSTLTYDSGNINSSINDNSCDPNSASIYTVPLAEVDSFVLSNPYTYLWTSDNSSLIINNAASTLNPIIDPAPTQDTWFYLTVTDSLNCVAVDSVFFHYQSTVVPVISGTLSSYCSNESPVMFSATPSGGTWSGSGMTNATFDPSQCAPGINTIYYTIQGQCPAIDSAQIEIFELPDILSAIDHESCQSFCDGNITLNSTLGLGPYQYSIDGGSTFSANKQYNGLCPGVFDLVVIDDNGCKDSSSLTILSAPAYSHSTTSYQDTCSQERGQAIVDIIGGTGPYDYVWSDGQQLLDSTIGTNSSSTSLINLIGQKYYVTITDANGCEIDDSIVVNSTPILIGLIPSIQS